MNLLTTTKMILDTRYKKLNSDTFPVKLRVTSNRKQKYYSTKFSFNEKDWNKLTGKKPGALKDNFFELNDIEKRASKIIDKLPFFSFELFEKKFLNVYNGSDLNNAFDSYAKQLRQQDRIGTAVSYECAKISLNKFQEGLRFTDITPDFLRRYEKQMIEDGNSITTIGIYLRNLRALFNMAIADGDLPAEIYPFGKRRFEIPTGTNKKKALTVAEIGKIYNHPATGTTEMAKDYWLFMYFCNGINCKDMCLLKYENIKGDIITFERSKTVRTKRKVEPVRIVLQDEAKAIIEKWGQKKTSPDTFIFPVLEKGQSAERQRQLIQQLTGLINDHMKIVAKETGIDKDCTTYFARHSFASVLKRSGASIEFIGEALGHSNLKTTQSYLAGFEDETLRSVTKALTAFKKSGKVVNI